MIRRSLSYAYVGPISGGGINIALGKTATQSSIEYGGAASRAVDGDTNGAWSGGSVTHTEAGSGSWWQVDLNGQYSIGDINIWNRTDTNPISRLSNYTVQILDASESPVWENIQTEYPDPSTTVNAGGTIGSYVKILQNSEEPLSLAEVEVFGSSGAATTFNNTALAATYTGSWITSSNRGAGDFDDDVGASKSANAAFEYTFTGTGIEYIAPMSNGYASAEIFIDGVSQGIYTTDNGGAYSPQEVIFSVSGLSQGQHTIKAVKTSGSWLQLDALVIMN